MANKSSPIETRKETIHADPDIAASQGSSFHARAPHDKPLFTKGHQPGLRTSPTDKISTFHAESLPAGSAPTAQSFVPENARTIDNLDDVLPHETQDMPGATSRDVNRGLGQPVQGMTSRELHHDGQTKRKKQAHGIVGMYGTKGKMGGDLGSADPRQDQMQRALEKDVVPRGVGREKVEHSAEEAWKEQAR